MQLFVYNDNRFEEHKNVTLHKVEQELKDKNQANDVKWLNVHRLHRC